MATRLRSTRCFARQRSWLYCIASQLSGERPRHFDNRNAISGLTPLAPVSALQRVQAESGDVNVIDDLRRVEGGQLHPRSLRMLRLYSSQVNPDSRDRPLVADCRATRLSATTALRCIPLRADA